MNKKREIIEKIRQELIEQYPDWSREQIKEKTLELAKKELINYDSNEIKEDFIVDEDYKYNLNNCIIILNKVGRINSNDKTLIQLFKMHNQYYKRQETGTYCTKCVDRVLSKMKKLNDILNNG